jgi:hypothetical protein
MGFFTNKKQHELDQRKKCHDEYLDLYKKFIDKLNESPYAEVKNICIYQCRVIKETWVNTLHFDLDELTALDPVDIKI